MAWSSTGSDTGCSLVRDGDAWQKPFYGDLRGEFEPSAVAVTVGKVVSRVRSMTELWTGGGTHRNSPLGPIGIHADETEAPLLNCAKGFTRGAGDRGVEVILAHGTKDLSQWTFRFAASPRNLELAGTDAGKWGQIGTVTETTSGLAKSPLGGSLQFGGQCCQQGDRQLPGQAEGSDFFLRISSR